jgi:membrane protease YdiL (CAAX protease family)
MRREGPWLVLGLVYPTVLVWVWFVLLAGGKDGGALQKTAYVVGKSAQFIYPVLLFWWLDRCCPRPARPRFEGLVLGLVFGLVTVAGMMALYYLWLKQSPLFHDTPALVRKQIGGMGLGTPAGYLVMTLFVSLLHSLLEEYYWRWFLFGRLRRHMKFAPACVLSSLGFMAHHVVVLWVYLPGYFWTAVIPLSLCIAAGGAMWAWLFEKTKLIYAAWLSHLLVDMAVFAIGYDILGGVFG